jgi:HEAT repeat protein
MEVLPEVINFLDHPQPVLRGYAAWAVGELKAKQAVHKLTLLTTDNNPVAIYINGEMHIKTVGDWAANSLAAIS